MVSNHLNEIFLVYFALCSSTILTKDATLDAQSFNDRTALTPVPGQVMVGIKQKSVKTKFFQEIETLNIIFRVEKG
jgi:hypothetical protein